MPPVATHFDSHALRSVVEHVFMPPILPQAHPGSRAERKTNEALCSNLINAARDFAGSLPPSESPLWRKMIKMMELALRAVRAPFEAVDLQRVLSDMAIGDVFCMHIRAQNAALIVRRPATTDFVQFEVFEVAPRVTAVMAAEGKLLCTYPGPAIQVPLDTLRDECFLRELSSFLVQMDVDRLDVTPTTSSAESVHPRYISELLVGILRGYGQPAIVDRVTKRIGDEVLRDGAARQPWRRSSLWLILKVTLESSLCASNLYKPFILFFHAHLLRICVRRNFASEVLYAMRVKMARRLSKLGTAVSDHIGQVVYNTAKETEALLSKRWTEFQAIGSTSPTLQLEGLDFVADTHITLAKSFQDLTNVLHPPPSPFSQVPFIRLDSSRLYEVHDFTRFMDGRFENAISEDQHIAIADFEVSVERNLESWVTASKSNSSSSSVIASCIQQYYAGAKDLYAANPEDCSMMILTIMDLWVALDRLAIQECPLLGEYPPEIPSNFLHPLLLHRSSALKRASHIEEYLRRRHQAALEVPSVFSNNVEHHSFAVKYFRSSKRLQHLYDKINTHAQQERVEKHEELASLNQESHTRSMRASMLEHGQSYTLGTAMHSTNCEKCKLERLVRDQTIKVHEWPLPRSTQHAQFVVFELSPPRAFSAWRGITYMILRDIGMPSVTDPEDQPKFFMDSFSGLQQWVQHPKYHRVTIGSTTNSYFKKVVFIPAVESSVFVENDLSFGLCDVKRTSWVIGSFSETSVSMLCIPPTPKSSPYSSLHFAVCGVQHSPNRTIASQVDCPDDINPHEFIAFSGLRSGPRLQWLNIARELASPSLSFSREEVHTLITQTAWQLGPLSNGAREWHIDLSIPSFGEALLRELKCLLEKIRANWLEEVTVRTIALICSRLLASGTDPEVCRWTCALLREARNVTYRWIGEVSARLDSTQDEASRAGLRRRLCMLAATCFSTFDVSLEHIPAILAGEEDVSVAMQCAVIVHDNTLSSLSDDSSLYLTRMLSRHRRLLHNLEPIFSQSLPYVLGKARLLHSDAYDHALARLWLGYHHDRGSLSSWHALPKPISRWISRVTKSGQEIHYDLLTGELLIGGTRLGILPKKIMEHPIYVSIFGTRTFDVAPADIPGTDYMTRSTMSGYQVLFSWKNGDLILQARKPGNPQILQLIPRSMLLGDFSRCLVDEYTHWLNLATGELEFRPAGSPWTPSPSNWRLYIRKRGICPRAMFLERSQDNSPIRAIDIHSNTFSVVSDLLSPLESPAHIIVTHAAQTLEISLPRLRLSFFVNTNLELECRSIPGYVVDNNQSCRTMFGLKNKLVLCPSPTGSEEPVLSRRVIIPQGEISFAKNGDFTSVSINTDAGQHVRWHEYTIDTDLRHLTSNTSLGSKLYQCYLHALTSFCLPDPLLGHTGTEEALCILRSAACRSFQRLDVQEGKLLELIGNLTPIRVYYSRHLQSMATVKWNDLPALSQHHDFFPSVCSLLDHARALETLYDPPTTFNTPDRNQTLLNRAACRNKVYYPSDMHTPEQSSSPSLNDVEYLSRGVSDQAAEHVAFRTSWSLWNVQPSLDHTTPKLWDLMKPWDSLGPAPLGPARTEISLRYSAYWLEFEATRDLLVICDLIRNSATQNFRDLRIELSFSLSAAAYSMSKYSNLVQFIIIFALDERCHNLIPPPDHFYTLSDGLAPELTRVEGLLSRSAQSMSITIPHHIQTNGRKSQGVESLGAEDKPFISRETSVLAESILRHWPNYQSVYFPTMYFDKLDCCRRIEEYIQSISRNMRLREHLLQLQDILQHYKKVPIPTAMPHVISPQFVINHPKSPSYLLRDVFISRANIPTTPADEESFQGCAMLPIVGSIATESALPPASLAGLETIIEELKQSRQPLLQLYGNELNKSHREQLGQNDSQFVGGAFPLHEFLLNYHHECSQRKNQSFSEISAALSPSQNVEEVSQIAGLWPRITPRSILRQLAQDRISTLPNQWKLVIMRFAVSFLKYQQSLRLLELFSRQRHEELLWEIEAIRHDVLVESTPDWLLVQIEANLVARPFQVAITREMISPTSKHNRTLQLNMGEGKSSVIVPLIASTLANGADLVRVVTLKPLSNQTFELLVGRLSGLANRHIFYVPIYRGLHINTSLIKTIKGIFERCASEGGVLVVQPEHILSLKLMHIDVLLESHGNDEARETADELGALHDWLTNVSRDVLDESDEILHVRYQVIYTAGKQLPVNDHPNRWITIQQVFGLLQTHAMELRASYPKMLDINTTLKGFPIIHVLDPAQFQRISSRIIDDALEGRLSTLPVGILPSQIHAAARRFMTQTEVSDVDHVLIHSYCAETTLFNGILLLRGLLMNDGGILGYVLKERRWRVDYGLDPSRTLLAVPYRAKDVPSPRAEFAHPDVAIALTCLSYYYGGLTKDQVLSCFDLLTKLDNPEMEYDHWVELGQDLPVELRQLNGVNLEDETQMDKFLVPLFSRNKGAVDFYLSQVVFPRAAREFQSKLPTSAWDLVEHKTNITTGFSGTNDNRYLLPTSITQEDPDFVLGTNALVLRRLLQPENDHYECVARDNGSREPATTFLKRLVKHDPEIRVLLDVGAQMLELQNRELALYWLLLRPDVSAAIFFNDSDHLTVITPDGATEPFISSPFNRQLDKCVVYLDDAHTRGTDLKLPQGMRAAVTLGPKVTKDRLVQGCMRMRQLGKGHSVMFFAPREVDHRIRGLIPSCMASGGRIGVLDVVRWAIHGTCEDICHHLTYWAHQGLDHHKRFAAYKEYKSSRDLAVLRNAWLQPESQTLEEMYWIAPGTKLCHEIHSVPSLSGRIEQLGVTKLVDGRMAEEQEREVNHEIEQEIITYIWRPPRVEPAEHVIHPDILDFVQTGKVPETSMHISPLLAPLNMVKALDSTADWSPSPLATTDFMTTVLHSDSMGLTEYLRPVNWILSSGSGKKSAVVVISQHEANTLLPTIRESNTVRLHIYATRVTYSMRSFSDLTFYSVPDSQTARWSAPAHVGTLLNLFSGQLYFDSREEYERVCGLLALSIAHPGAKYSEVDGFVPPMYRTGMSSPFTRSRISILKTLIGLRRKGKGYHLTHLGQVLNGKPLSEEILLGLLD